MICITENDLRIQLAQLTRTHGFDAALRPHRHERRRFDYAVRRRESAATRLRIRICFQQLEHERDVRSVHVRRNRVAIRARMFLRAQNSVCGCAFHL
jgi:nitric oxide reductase activation protein